MQGQADSETSLLYNGARYRDPRGNRFITPDPRSIAEHVQRWRVNLGVPGQSPVELNPYVAVSNNPLRWIDPTGFGVAGVAGEIVTYVGGAATVGGLATGNPLLFYGGLGVAAVGGALQVYDKYQEGEEAKNAIDKAKDVVNQSNEKTKERQEQYDKLKLFPPKSTPPNCP